MSDCVILFVKYPEPGAVKTRIAEDSSPQMAAEFYTVCVEEKLDELSTMDGVALIVCYAPESAGKAMAAWLGPKYRYIAQKGTELGRRMENAFRESFFMGHDRVVLAGSDIPGLSPTIIKNALAGLTPEKACIGPADDGGYYLIGFHRKGFAPKIFREMEWSTPNVLQHTVNRFAEMGLAFFELQNLEDMDTFEDVETLVALGSAGPLKGRVFAAAKRLTGM